MRVVGAPEQVAEPDLVPVGDLVGGQEAAGQDAVLGPVEARRLGQRLAAAVIGVDVGVDVEERRRRVEPAAVPVAPGAGVVGGPSVEEVGRLGGQRGREDAGVGARSAVGMGSLPGNIPVEVECIFEV